MIAHSALPYHVSPPQSRLGLFYVETVYGTPVAVCESEADANLIVKACNHHGELVDALRSVIKAYANSFHAGSVGDGDAVYNAILLLAEIEGES